VGCIKKEDALAGQIRSRGCKVQCSHDFKVALSISLIEPSHGVAASVLRNFGHRLAHISSIKNPISQNTKIP
jgi:hypothetical protein